MSKVSAIEDRQRKLEQDYRNILKKLEERPSEKAEGNSQGQPSQKEGYILTKTDDALSKKDNLKEERQQDIKAKDNPYIKKEELKSEIQEKPAASALTYIRHNEKNYAENEQYNAVPSIAHIFSWTGGMLLVLGAAYTFVYLYQKGHISHAVIMTLAELIGIAIAAAGIAIRKENMQATSSALCAAGISVCYLTAYSAHAFYGLIGTGTAFAAMAITAFASFIISAVKNKQFIAFLALAAACLTPNLLSSGQDKYLFYFVYIFIVNIPAAALAIRRKWDWLMIISLIFTFMAQFGYAADMPLSVKTGGYFWSVCLAYSLTAGIAGYIFAHKESGRPETAAYSSTLSFFSVSQLIPIALSLAAGNGFRCFISSLIITAMALMAEHLRKTGTIVYCTLAAWGFFYALFCSSNGNLHYNAIAPIAVFAMFYSFPLIFRSRFMDGGQQWLSSVAASFMLLLPLYKDFAKPNFPDMAGIVPLILALLYLIPSFVYFKDKKQHEKTFGIYVGAAMIMLAAGISMQLSGKWLTSVMAMYAALLCYLDNKIQNRALIPLSRMMFIVSAARLLIYADDPSYFRPDLKIFNGCLISYGLTAGAMIVAARYFLHRHEGFRKMLYVSSAAIIFILLNIEIADFFTEYGRIEFNFCGKFAEAITYTLAWAIYGAAACAISAYNGSGALRKCGIIAIALALAKLGLIDLWKLETLYRIFGAFGMAALLMGTAWLFQRESKNKKTD